MSDVFLAAKGHYDALLRNFFPECIGMLQARGRHVPDPYRSGSKDGARVDKDFNNNGRLYFNSNVWGLDSSCVTFYQLMIATGNAKNQRDFFVKVGSFLGLPEYEKGYHESRKERMERELRDRKMREEQERIAKAELERRSAEAVAKNKEMLKDTIPLFSKTGDINPDAVEVWKYFFNRGLAGLINVKPSALRNLRCAVQLEYYLGKGKKSLHFDSLVCRVQTEKDEGVQLHRTYLKDGKKADVECPKKLTASDERLQSKCRYIKIGEPVEGVVGIAEGVETALSVYLATGLGCYCCVCAQNMKNFVLPEGCHTVAVFADKDKSKTGEIAARELVAKFKEQRNADAFVVLPKQPIPEGAKGIDWNDVLQMYGAQAFPSIKTIMTFVRNRQSKFNSSARR